MRDPVNPSHPVFFALVALLPALVACGGGGGGGGSVSDLARGSCVSPRADAVELAAVDTVPCTAPHRWEVLGSVTLGGADAAFPGRRALLQEGWRACVPLFEQYTGQAVWRSSHDIETITPTARAWADGARNAVCLGVDPDGEPLSASIAKVQSSPTP